MNTKQPSIFVALEQYANISVQECDSEFLGENIINTVKTILIKDCGKVAFEILISPFVIIIKSPFEDKIFSEEAQAYCYLEEYCSVIDLTETPTYLQKILNEEQKNVK